MDNETKEKIARIIKGKKPVAKKENSVVCYKINTTTRGKIEKIKKMTDSETYNETFDKAYKILRNII